MTSQFADMTSSSNFLDIVMFLLSSLVIGPSFMSILSLILELWQFSFTRDWPEMRKLEIPPSEFCPISRGWGMLGIPNLAQMSLMKCCWLLQNAKVTAFTVSELLRENQQGRGDKITPLPTQVRVKELPPPSLHTLYAWGAARVTEKGKIYSILLIPRGDSSFLIADTLLASFRSKTLLISRKYTALTNIISINK